MGAESSKNVKQPNFNNIDTVFLTKLQTNLLSKGETQEFKTKESAMKAFPSTSIAAWSLCFDKLQEKGVLKIKKLLETLDKLIGDTSDQSDILLTLYETPLTAVKEVSKIFAREKKLSVDEEAIFIGYLIQNLTQEHSQFHKWMQSNSIFPQIVLSVFEPFVGKVGPPLTPKLSTKSCILNAPGALIVLNSHLPMERRKNWTLLFNSSIHGCSFSQLYNRVNGEGPCLIVVESTIGSVFGCFASEGLVSGPQYRGDERCFLFEIKPQLRIHMATGRSVNYGYLNAQQSTLPNGLGMGGYEESWPFFIHEEFGKGQCIANMTSFEKCQIAGATNFEIKNVEAWRVGEKPKLTEEEEEHIRKEKSIIDKDPEAKALLEMSGRKMHSEAYRDAEPILDEEE